MRHLNTIPCVPFEPCGGADGANNDDRVDVDELEPGDRPHEDQPGLQAVLCGANGAAPPGHGLAPVRSGVPAHPPRGAGGCPRPRRTGGASSRMRWPTACARRCRSRSALACGGLAIPLPRQLAKLLQRADMSLDLRQLAVGTVHEAPELAVIEARNVSIPWTHCPDVSTPTPIMDISRACGWPLGRSPVHGRLRRPSPQAPVIGGSSRPGHEVSTPRSSRSLAAVLGVSPVSVLDSALVICPCIFR